MENTDDIRSLSILELVGPVCALMEDGKRINRIVQHLLNQGASLKLNFYGVKLVTPSFYAAVTDGLYSVFPESDRDITLTMSNLPVPFAQRQP